MIQQIILLFIYMSIRLISTNMVRLGQNRLDNILYRKRTWDRVPTNPGNPTNLWLSYGSAEGRT